MKHLRTIVPQLLEDTAFERLHPRERDGKFARYREGRGSVREPRVGAADRKHLRAILAGKVDIEDSLG